MLGVEVYSGDAFESWSLGVLGHVANDVNMLTL